MKITFEILGLVFLLLAAIATVRFFLERRREQKAQQEGVVVYATVVSVEAVKWFAKLQQPVKKITLRVQDPGSITTRDVAIRTRVDPKQKLTSEMRLPVVIDPKDSKRVYPASAEAAKRVVLTGSRLERRTMQSQLRSPRRGQGRPPSGYQPPLGNKRPR